MKTYGVDGAAAFLNISADTMKGLAQNGIVPGAKIGKGWVFTDEDLEAYVREEIRRQTAERRGIKAMAVPTPSVPTAFTRTVRRKARIPPPLPSV